jgi:pimeloyl-ACP methyl ester carboxylesterase
VEEKQPACILLHLDGKAEALKHPLAADFLEKGWLVAAPDLRATGEAKPDHDAVGVAPDHNSTEHALWIGRPLLGQWIVDVRSLLDWLALQPRLDRRRLFVAGIGQGGIVAICAAGVLDDRVAGVVTIGSPTTFVTEEAYGPRTRMGLLAPGIVRLGDVPQLAALAAPRRLILAEGVSPQGKKLEEKQLKDAFAFTSSIYKLHKAETKLTITDTTPKVEMIGTSG